MRKVGLTPTGSQGEKEGQKVEDLSRPLIGPELLPSPVGMELGLDKVLKAEFLCRVCLGVPSGRPFLRGAVCAQHKPK